MRDFLRQLQRLLGLNAAVSSGLFARMAQMSLAPIGAFVVVYTLTVEKQGIYYLLVSLMALRSFFELGVGMSIQQVASHNRRTAGDNHSNLIDENLVYLIRRWMTIAGTAFTVVVGLAGTGFLAYQGHSSGEVLLAFGLMAVSSGLLLKAEGYLSVLMGGNKVVTVNLLRLKSSLLQSVLQWVLLGMGAGLISFGVASLAAWAFLIVNMMREEIWLFQCIKSNEERYVQFRGKLLGLVKKSSKTYFSGYFVDQLTQPVCFHFLGAAASARLGFTSALVIMVVGIANIWLTATFPQFAHQVSENAISAARRLFFSSFAQATLALLAGFLAVGILIHFLRHLPRFEDRLLDNCSVMLLFAVFFLKGSGLNLTYYARAFQVEPFVPIAIVQMVITPLLLWFLTQYFAMEGLLFSLFASWTVGIVGISVISIPYIKAPQFPLTKCLS